MSNAILHTNAKGFPVNRASYSSIDDFKFCNRKFKLKRIDGWSQKRTGAALEFGKAIEAAIQHYYQDYELPNYRGPGALFKTLWMVHEHNAALDYSAKEGDWAGLNKCGQEMLRLFEIYAPTFPIARKPAPRFQVNLKKRMFPGSALDNIEFTSFLDMVAQAPIDHPMLARTTQKEWPLGYRPVIVDIKTASVELNMSYNILSLDPQVRAYSWISSQSYDTRVVSERVRDVAFLQLVKNTSSIGTGDVVTLLANAGEGFSAGQKVYAAKAGLPPIDEIFGSLMDDLNSTREEIKERSKTPEPVGEILILPDREDVIEAWKLVGKDIKGKGAREAKATAKAEFLNQWAAKVAPDALTKVKVQFVAANISPDKAEQIGRIIEQQVAQIVDANERNVWEQTGAGIRFPNTNCLLCEMRPICLDDPKGVAETLVKIGAMPSPVLLQQTLTESTEEVALEL